MRHRTSVEEDKHAVSLRRSPRFLPKNQQDLEHPVTPEIEPRAIRVPNADSTPLSSNRKISLNKKQREASGRTAEKSNGSVMSGDSSTGPRRSSRLISRFECSKEVSKKAKAMEITNGSVISSNSCTRSRRSSILVSQVEDFTPLRRSKRIAENGSFGKRIAKDWIEVSSVEKGYRDVVVACPAIRNSNKTPNPPEIKSKPRVNSSNKSVLKSEKRATRSSCLSQADEGKAKHGGRIGKPSTSKLEKIETFPTKSPSEVAIEGGENPEESIDLGEKQRGVKRKRAQEEDGHVIAKGWTKEQELALQKAYFAAKATPKFWKKVAKMVPGKSAQECFDRIHLDHLTPPQPRPRSRAKKAGLLLSPPSASKLLQTADANAKKLRCSKLKSHFSQKAVREVREMMEKQYNNIDRDKEADVFSVLESRTDQSNEAFQEAANVVTPEVKLDRVSFLGRCSERSSSGHKVPRSQLSNLPGAALFSPPVLKPIKNKALHDRYIDQLHCREARRTAASLRTATHNHRNGNQDQQVNTIQDAKNALIFDARDAIHKFQNSQTNLSNILNDGEDDDDCDYNNDNDNDGVDED
ncbi:PREDICTED: uncharacterized protein LOC109168390 [Ipomoea nil]|uniref:uncharacterized protein LOC109168390 n=1 Tax=Ipomoea nil TaxID=35883 RepID=UPI000901028B|nr:PREDICTED: uncharacterized protein LOC109168390 [Ipomoea nil]